MIWKLQENILDKADLDALVEFIKTTDRFTQFKKVKEFEDAWSSWQGCRYSVFVNSGSSANFIIINTMKQLHDWQDGDEVLVPAVTWVTNVSPVMQCGLTPVFVDVNIDDFSFNYDELSSKITPRTRAIFVTHLIGFPADMARIQEIARERNLVVLEDCCESHGASIGGRKVGNFGSVNSFSFYWGHHMTTVEGGMICTEEEKIYDQSLLKRSHGLARELPKSRHEALKTEHPDIDFSFLFLTDGFNFRNTEFNAVLGLSQIKRLDWYIALRVKNYLRFLELVNPYREYLIIPYKEGLSPFCLPFLFRDKEMKTRFQGALTEAGVESRPVVSGNLLRQPFLKTFASTGKFKNADFLHLNAFYIGNNQFVNEDRLSYLGDLLKKFFGR